MMTELCQALRIFRQAPGVAAAVVASLALGIAVNTAVFSFVNAIQFKPLPVEDEATLVDLSETSQTELCSGCAVGTSYPTYLHWKSAAASFGAMAAYREERFVVSGSGVPERVGGALVSAGLFSMIGVQPALGRGFEAADDAQGAAPVVILSDLLWKTRFASDPHVLGTAFKINGIARTIVGVMPPDFGFPEFARLWLPLAPAAGDWTRTDRSLAVVARLRRGVGIEAARAEMRALAAAHATAYPDSHARWTAQVVTLRDDMTSETAMASTVLLGAVGFVLLVACANVANLLLARTLGRRREVAVRLALGASRWRVVRMMLLESLLLSTTGGTLGLLVALWASQLVVAALRTEAPYWIRFGVDWRVFAFCTLVTALAALFCGAAPALQASRRDVNSELRDGGTTSSSRGARRVRHALTVGQLALALILLACAGLLIKTVVRTFDFDAGYDTSRVLVGDLNLEGPAYEAPSSIEQTASTILERIPRRDGIRAALSRTVFFRGFGATPRRMWFDGGEAPEPASPSFYFAVTDEYFSIVNVSLRQGRLFAAGERSDAVIVNETLRRRVWGERSAIGGRLRFGDDASKAPWLTVVGVVADSTGSPIAPDRDRPAAYVPFASQPGRSFSIYVGTPGSAAQLISEVRAAVRAADPDLPIEDLMTMEQAFARWVAPARFVAMLMTSLSVLATLLASLGLYGVMSYGIGQRTRELGVRLALGATPRQVQLLVVRSGAWIVAAGVVIGAAGAWASTRMLEGILAGTSATDPTVFGGVVCALAVVGLLASWLPAKRVTSVDAFAVLRSN